MSTMRDIGRNQSVEVVHSPAVPTTVTWIQSGGPGGQLSAARLLRLAKRYTPPQAWYDEPGDCPFTPKNKR